MARGETLQPYPDLMDRQGAVELTGKPAAPGCDIVLYRGHGTLSVHLDACVGVCSQSRLYRGRCISGVGTGVVFLFARDKQHQVTEILVIVGSETDWRSFGENFAAIVYVKGVGELPSGSGSNQGIQIDQGAVVFPQDGVQSIGTVRGKTHNLSPRVQSVSPAACIAIHRTEVLDLSVFPNDGVMKVLSRQVDRADDQS
jgi:hypothetical protein